MYNKNKILVYYFFLFFISSLLLPFISSAGEHKKVTICAYSYGTLFQFNEKQEINPSYAAEYIEKIAAYAGWDVNYIQTKDFVEAYEKTKNCESDLCYFMVKTEQRVKDFLFPENSMGTERFVIFAKKGDPRINVSNLRTLNGKKIGIADFSDIAKTLQAWLKKNDLNCQIILFSTLQEKLNALLSGEVDLDCDLGSFTHPEYSPIAIVKEYKYYLVANKNRADLLEDINNAQKKISQSNPYFLSQLSEKYFYKTSAAKALSEDEQEWLSKHNTIRIGFIDDYYPFCFVNNATGKISGIGVDLARLFLKNLNLQDIKLEYHFYKDTNEAVKELYADNIDLVYPYYKNTNLLKKQGILTTVESGSNLMSAVFRKGSKLHSSLKKIAIKKSSIAVPFTKDHFAESKIQKYDTYEECLNAVKQGTATCAIAAAHIINNLAWGDESLQFRNLPEDCVISFAATSDEISLISILDRADSITPLGEFFAIQEKYNLPPKQDILSFLRSHLPQVIVIVFLVFLTYTFAFVQLFRTNRKLIETSAIVLTQKEKLEEQQSHLIDALDKVTAANSAKTSFLFNINHDIRTPMNAILGFCNMAVKNIQHSETVLNCLYKLRKSGEFLLLVLNDILDITSMEIGNIHLTITPKNINQIFEAIEPMLQQKAREKKINLSFYVDNIKYPYVLIDVVRVSTILNNLINNALSFNKEGGWVKVRLEQTEDFFNDDPVYSFTVEDNGIGMSEEFQKQMFEPFAKENTSTLTGNQGAGLGLTLCHQLVDLMGGSIHCTSSKDVGTCFSIKIPCKIVEKTPQETATESPPSFEGKKVLIVEDNELNAEILADILEDKKIIVEIAKDGEIAIKKLLQVGAEYFDIILMDIQMPIKNGYETTKAIRAMFPNIHIPIIAVSANAFEDDKKKSIASGMDDHLAKPIEATLLFSTMSRYLS